MTDNLNDKSLKAPLPTSIGKPEITDGTNWFTLATENWVMNREGLAPALAASSVNLTATYGNGTNGVGATLTNAQTPQTILSIDGTAPAVGSRILIKDQTSAFQNGIYTVTNAGSASTNWVLTRTTDFDTPSQMTQGKTIDVITGNANAASGWMLTSASVTAVGTSAISFTRLAKGTGIDNIFGTIYQIQVTQTSNPNNATIKIIENPIIPGNACITIPVGTTAQRPQTQIAGSLRFNTSLT
jgi:hypothetical protein